MGCIDDDDRDKKNLYYLVTRTGKVFAEIDSSRAESI
jgi:hypothetical protein